MAFSEELQLLVAAALNALVLWACARFVRRRAGGDAVAATADSLLLWIAVQYVAVTLPGWLGVLSLGTVCAVAVAIAAGLWLGAGRNEGPHAGLPHTPDPHPNPLPEYRERGEYREKGEYREREARRAWVLPVCVLFLAGYLAAVVQVWALAPMVSIDALAYHAPAAAQWLQDGRISVFQAWYYNPANAYSPLGGSAFIAWWMAPLHNDVLARFSQIPALLLIFFAMVSLGRSLGASTGAAALVALAAVLSRPFISQTILSKDDLYVAAFFVAAAAGGGRARLSDRLGPWRIGIALGLLFSVKYTALLAAPVLLAAIDAPVRAGWRWRRWLVCAGCVIVLAGPWYVRNCIVAGNPLFPMIVSVGGWEVFPGILRTAPSEQLSSLAGVWHALGASYHALPAALAGLLAAGWLMAGALAARRFAGDPLIRLCLVGPPIALGAFVVVSPYPEIRFLYPALLLMFGCCAIALGRARWPAARWTLAGALAGAAALTGFAWERLGELLVGAAVVAAVGAGSIYLWRRLPLLRRPALWAGSAAAVALMWVYVNWYSYLDEVRRNAPAAWSIPYGDVAEAWAFVRDPDRVAPDATIAYANTYCIYPLYGSDLRHRVIHVPISMRIEQYAELPPLEGRLSGERIEAAVLRATLAGPDYQTWLARLRSSGADYLLVATHGLNRPRSDEPKELHYAKMAGPEVLREVFRNEAAVVYRVIH